MPAKKQIKNSAGTTAGAKDKTTGKKITIKVKDLKTKKNPEGGGCRCNTLGCVGNCGSCAISG